MNQRHRIALVAGAATLLSSTALASVYQSAEWGLYIIDSPNWFFYVAFAIAAVVGGASGFRTLNAPAWAQPLGGLLALLLYVTVVFGDGFLGIIPTPASFGVLADQINVALSEIGELSAPVPVHRGLLLLGVLGVGVVAATVDFLAVAMRRAALAGLPLLALYAVPVTIERDGGVRVSTFMFGAAGYLWLLASEHIGRVQRWGRPFRARSQDELWATTPLGTTGRWLGLAGIGVAVLVPAMFVQLIAPNFTGEGLFGSGRGFGSGNGGKSVSTINPMTSLHGQLTQEKEVEALRLRTNDRQRFYLRTATLDQFDRTGWVHRKLTATDDERVDRGITDDEQLDPEVQTRKQRTTVELRGMTRSSYLPVYANPTKVDIEGDWRWDDQADTLFSSRSVTGRQEYEFESTRVIYDRDKLAQAPALDPSDALMSDYTAIGSGEPEAEQIAQKLTKDKKSQYDKVMAIQNYFSPSNGFVYSLTTRPGPGNSLLMDFLNGKQGFCQQYASAMAFLVRAADIPARVAIGFTRGRETKGYISVTNKDAHAWVEVYFAGHGWVPFDPTPSTGTGGRTGALDWARSTDGPDNGANPGASPTPSTTTGPGSVRPEPTDDPTNDDAALPQGGDTRKRFEIPGWMPLLALALDGHPIPDIPIALGWLLLILAGLLVASVPAAVRHRLRARRMSRVRRGDPVEAAHAAWDELVDVLADFGMPVIESETPRVTLRRLSAVGLDDADRHAVELLAAAEERARYAPRPESTRSSGRAEATQRILAVQVVARSIADKSPMKVRLRAWILPPSLLQRVGIAMAQFSEDLSIGMRDVQIALRRRIVTR